MKKHLCLFLAVLSLFLSACTADAPAAEPTVTTMPETVATSLPTETTAPEAVLLPLPEESAEFAFLSGAGAWQTAMILHRDGTFTGQYHDSEMGDMGEGYPNGTVYICTFSGKFENIEKIDEFSYKMTLTEIITENEEGEEWIENEIRYVAAGPHGLNDPINAQECREFIFYLPDTPVDQLNEEFLSWWPYRYLPEEEAKTTLSCYGILNVTALTGFFATDY